MTKYIDATWMPRYILATPELNEFIYYWYRERGADYATSWIY